MLVFKLSRKLAMCYAGRQTLEKKANCGKSARRNTEIKLLKVHFYNLELSTFYNNLISFD